MQPYWAQQLQVVWISHYLVCFIFKQNCIYLAHFVSGGKTHVLHTAYAITEIVAWHHVYNVKLHQYKKTAML